VYTGAAEELVEVVYVYLSWFPLYPVASAIAVVLQPMSYVPWLIAALVGTVLFARLRIRSLWKIWVAVVVMPTTIICGSWELVPWPMGLLALGGEGECSTILSVLVCLLLNLIVVYAGAGVFGFFNRNRRRRCTIKP
jgi:hypothetical protein